MPERCTVKKETVKSKCFFFPFDITIPYHTIYYHIPVYTSLFSEVGRGWGMGGSNGPACLEKPHPPTPTATHRLVSSRQVTWISIGGFVFFGVYEASKAQIMSLGV